MNHNECEFCVRILHNVYVITGSNNCNEEGKRINSIIDSKKCKNSSYSNNGSESSSSSSDTISNSSCCRM